MPSGKIIGRRVGGPIVKKLTKVQCGPDRYYLTFPGGTKASRSNVTFVKAEDVPPFEGDYAWFEMEMVTGPSWSYWRAIRPVEPSAADIIVDART